MSDLKQQIRHLCAWNRKLARDGSLLRLRVRNQEIEIAELRAALAKVHASADLRLAVSDIWLKLAMNQLTEHEEGATI